MKVKQYLIVILLFLLFFFVITGIISGPVKVTLPELSSLIYRRIYGGKSGPLKDAGRNIEYIILNIRLPRLMLNVLTGAALAGAGAVYQGLFRNKMADPYLIGLSSGASLGATAVMAYRPLGMSHNFWLVPATAFAGSMTALWLVYRIAGGKSESTPGTLLLGGIAVSLTLSAFSSFIMVVSGRELNSIVFWLMGGFTSASWIQVYAVLPFIAAGLGCCLLYTKELNLLTMGESRAHQLGVEVRKTKRVLLFSASVAVAGAVSVSGLIGFVGLIVPHLIRLIGGEDYKILLPGSIICGAALLTFSDTLARTAFSPLEIPVGIVTAVCGGPFFLSLLMRRKELV